MVASGTGLRAEETARELFDVVTQLCLATLRGRRRPGDLKEVEFLTLSILHDHGTMIVGDIQRWCPQTYPDPISPSPCDLYGGYYTWAQTMALPNDCNGMDCAAQSSADSPSASARVAARTWRYCRARSACWILLFSGCMAVGLPPISSLTIAA